MTYITVDVNADEVLSELDYDDILDFIEYNMDDTDVLRRIDQDEMVTYLIDNENYLIFTESDNIKAFLEKKDAYGLMNFVYKTYEQQIGEVHEAITN